MELLRIKEKLEDNTEYLHQPECQPNLGLTVDFFNRIGYHLPWVGYFASVDGQLVGSGAFKGQPTNGTVEIAYVTFEQFQQQGVGTEICRQLVLLAQESDTAVRVTARTLPEPNFSTRILEKNGFRLLGMVNDPEDGDVWEWEYVG